jgi:hypothetical protein
MLAVIREICAVETDDGVAFNAAGLAVDLIRGEFEYGGLRVKTDAEIAGAREHVIDIGFGDAIELRLHAQSAFQRTFHAHSPLIHRGIMASKTERELVAAPRIAGRSETSAPPP